MIDLRDLASVQHGYAKYVVPLFDRIEALGGAVAREVVATPDEGARLASDDSGCYWIQRFYGEEFHSWDEVVEHARGLIGSKLAGLNLTNAMRRLVSSLTRQNTPVTRIAQHPTEKDLSPTGALRKAVALARETDEVYFIDSFEEAGKHHLCDYLYKFSPLSHYCPPIWVNNAEAYKVTREVTLTEEELDIIAELIVELQRALGITSAVHSLDPASLEDTQARARENNPNNAHSLPTMTNGKDEDARAEQLVLAREYETNFRQLGVLPFVGARRIQQGGNILNKVFEVLYPSFNPSEEYPSDDMVVEALIWCWNNRPHYTVYVKDKPTDFDNRYMAINELPDGESEREQLVDAGYHDSCILLKFKPAVLPNGKPNWRFNYLLEEASPWKMIIDDPDMQDDIVQEYGDMLLSKNRVVFAGAGPATLNQERFTHVFKDFIKDQSVAAGHAHLTDVWKSPIHTLVNLTGLYAAVNDREDAHGQFHPVPDDLRIVAGALSGDDKSKFDNFQCVMFHSLFNACFMGPLFKPEWYPLMKHLALQTLYPRIITFKGMMCLSEAMPSGHGTTNDQDTTISWTAGGFDVSRRTKVRPKAMFELFKYLKCGMQAQGDDYEGFDQEGLDGDAKQSSFTKVGLEMSVSKSLIGKRSLEFVRMYATGTHRCKLESGEDILCLHAPISHALVKVYFGEDISNMPLAIEAIANISRLNNCYYHPRIVSLVKNLLPDLPFGLGTRDTWYVPDFMLKEYREAGSPKPPSKYHVLINSPARLNEVAAKEAELLGTNLTAMVASWQAQQYGKASFDDLPIVRLLNAIREGDEAYLNQVTASRYIIEY